jgi:sigma-B regulation protein RsbU (phosphoserine phosphatase)
MDLRPRLEDLSRFAKGRRGREAPGAARAPHAFDVDYWRSVQELFTRDVTGRGLVDLVQHETRDTYNFFTREIDFSPLRSKRWYKRYPLAAWMIFLAMAYRLSPARRILFALGVPILGVAYVWYIFEAIGGEPPESFKWLLFGSSLLLVLLVLELKDNLALKGDLEVARQIQFGLLPFEPYERAGVAIQASMRPANTVGGDYFDIVELARGRLAIVIGDVAGKGMPAALLMALLQGSLRTLLTAGLHGRELLTALNAHLVANIPPNRLVTLFYGELDPENGEIRYINAGHNPPFLLRVRGGTVRLEATSMALGVLPEASFEEGQVFFEAGDRLFLYTDGVTEAFNSQDIEYGEERLETFLSSQGAVPAKELLSALLDDVVAFCGSVRPRDDMTAMVVDRASGVPA